MVEDSDEPAIPMSFTCYIHATRHDALLHRVHEVMRSLGIKPPAVGKHGKLDSMTHVVAASYADALPPARRLTGGVIPSDGVPYAIVKNS